MEKELETIESSHANSKTRPGVVAWFLCGVSSFGMLIFAVLYFLNLRTAGRTQTTIQTVTNTIEVPNEVEKITKVPAEIPETYRSALSIVQKMTNATSVGFEQVLFKMTDVRFACVLDTNLKDILTQDEVKAKFELALRRNNVPLNPSSEHVLSVIISSTFVDPL